METADADVTIACLKHTADEVLACVCVFMHVIVI